MSLALLGGASAQFSALPSGYASSTVPVSTQTTTTQPGVQYAQQTGATTSTTTSTSTTVPVAAGPTYSTGSDPCAALGLVTASRDANGGIVCGPAAGTQTGTVAGSTTTYGSTTYPYPTTGTTQTGVPTYTYPPTGTTTVPAGTDPCAAYGLVKTAASTATNIVCGSPTGTTTTTTTGTVITGTQQTGTVDGCTARFGAGWVTQAAQGGTVYCVQVTGSTTGSTTTTTAVDKTTTAYQAKVCVGTFKVNTANCKATECLKFQTSCKDYGFTVTPLVKPPVSTDPVIVPPTTLTPAQQAKAAKVAQAKALCLTKGITAAQKKSCKANGYPLYNATEAAACLKKTITAAKKKTCQTEGYPLYSAAAPAPAPTTATTTNNP